MLAGRALAQLKQEYPELQVHEIDVVNHPIQSWDHGIRLFPALKAGEQIVSSVLLGRKEIRKFIEQQLAMQ